VLLVQMREGAVPAAARGRSRGGRWCVVRKGSSFIARVRWRKGAAGYWVGSWAGSPNNSSSSAKIWGHDIIFCFQKFCHMHLIS
jgi:hypothetical protein